VTRAGPLEVLALRPDDADVTITGMLALDLLLASQVGQHFGIGTARLDLAVGWIGQVGVD
jgi:hypothetical protein